MDPRIIVSHMAHLSTAPVPPFTEAAAAEALAGACAQVRLDPAGARLLRFGENAIYHLPDAGVVVRIARTMRYWDNVTREVQISQWLEQACFPAARIAPITGAQPIQAASRPVTFWRFIDGRTGDPGDIASLGRLLRRLHQMPRPAGFSLPREEILGRVRGRMETAPVAGDDRDFLLQRLDELAAELPRLQFPLQPCVTHGDAHVQNVMVTPAGQPLLIDFERTAFGQPEWDLGMTATEYLTAGWWTPAQYGEFCRSYGYDVTEWDGFPLIRAVHELKMCSWLAQNTGQSPAITREFETRMRTLRGGPGRNWQPF